MEIAYLLRHSWEYTYILFTNILMLTAEVHHSDT